MFPVTHHSCRLQFIKSQDKLFKEQHAANMASAPVGSSFLPHSLAHKISQQGTFEEAEVSFRSQIKVLEEELARQKVCSFSCLPFCDVNGLSRV
jgi:hypothetical protein